MTHKHCIATVLVLSGILALANATFCPAAEPEPRTQKDRSGDVVVGTAQDGWLIWLQRDARLASEEIRAKLPEERPVDLDRALTGPRAGWVVVRDPFNLEETSLLYYDAVQARVFRLPLRKLKRVDTTVWQVSVTDMQESGGSLLLTYGSSSTGRMVKMRISSAQELTIEFLALMDYQDDKLDYAEITDPSELSSLLQAPTTLPAAAVARLHSKPDGRQPVKDDWVRTENTWLENIVGWLRGRPNRSVLVHMYRKDREWASLRLYQENALRFLVTITEGKVEDLPVAH